jgi:hypothetical protein
MSTNKPGDFKVGDIVKAIIDPESRDGHSNIGKLAVVVDLNPPMTLFDFFVAAEYGKMAELQCLESFWGVDTFPAFRRKLCKPGALLCAPTVMFVRVDPPGEEEDVFSETSLPSERQAETKLAVTKTKEPLHGTPA